MKLAAFAARNYRSILKTDSLELDNFTVLVGANNEGKSNLLSALVTSLDILKAFQSQAEEEDDDFDWDDIVSWRRDFPVHADPNAGESIQFDLKFELTDEEQKVFEVEVGNKINGKLPVTISIKRHEAPEFSVPKQGPGGASLSKKHYEIALFLGKRIDIRYIPAIRTAEGAQKIIGNFLERELRRAETQPAFKDALKKIREIQDPVLDALSDQLRASLQDFLPSIKKVELRISQDARRESLRRLTEVIIDDGRPTSIQTKGDGVKSLAALALMRFESEKRARNRQIVLTVEEPESHLHPEAIHQVRSVLEELAKRHQIIITTHNPILVNRFKPGANIIVADGKARPARRIEDIRRSLGIKVSDNLRDAAVILLVEGQDDELSMRAILGHCSQSIQAALKSGAMAIEPLYGAGKLEARLAGLQASLCRLHVFLDDDDAGRLALKTAEGSGLIANGDSHFARRSGYKNSEFEDLLRWEFTERQLTSVGVKSSALKKNIKWSEKVALFFSSAGVNFDDMVKADLKLRIAKDVERSKGKDCLDTSFENVMASLQQRLEAKLAGAA